MGAQAEAGQDALSLRLQGRVGIDASPHAAGHSFAFEKREFDLPLDSEVRRQRRDLEGAGQAGAHATGLAQLRDVLSAQPDLAAVGREDTADLVDERGLAGPVGADQCQPVAGLQRERHMARHVKPAEALVQRLEFEQCTHRAPPLRRRNQAQALAGDTRTTSMSKAPTTNSQWYGLMEAAV
ncbi:hypothetical protein D3C85_1052820 [compost metagenome]